MSFRIAVEKTPALQDAWYAGLQALRSADKRHVGVEDGDRLDGSVDLDSTLKDDCPNDPRWDYGIGHKDGVVYWIEIHPATSGEIDAVLAKVEWLLSWLREDAPELLKLRREIIWLSSGKTSLSPNARQRKRIAVRGLQQKGGYFSIPRKPAD